MLGVQDFVGYYDWTFAYLERNYGRCALQRYWRQAVALDAQQHARRLFLTQGIDGMQAYWSHTLDAEDAGYTLSRGQDFFRIDMFDCPSLGYLIKHHLRAYHDYCAHCMAWIVPLMDEAGFVVDHEHNHAGQCYFEMHRANDRLRSHQPPPIRDREDVRNNRSWKQSSHHLYLHSKLVE